MAVKTFTAGSVLTASDTNTYLANAGLDYVKGATLATAATHDIESAFSSTYTNYLLVLSQITTSQASIGVRIRMKTASTVYDGTGHKQMIYGITSGGGTANVTSATETFIYTTDSGVTTTNSHGVVMEILQPNLANPTICTTRTAFQWTDAWYMRHGATVVDTTTQYTGFRIYTTAGTVAITYALYGFRLP